ncbi:unannotated protein [freshwater metagenome]|uniref:Unannotated protein n=1 Tax=freshwater metagenome TaxID=449393 RepID=A0A6J6PZN7_9ZZZZ
MCRSVQDADLFVDSQVLHRDTHPPVLTRTESQVPQVAQYRGGSRAGRHPEHAVRRSPQPLQNSLGPAAWLLPA